MKDKMSNGEIAVKENEQQTTIIEQKNPQLILDDATYIANKLADIIKQKKLYKKIGEKEHVLVEGWTTLGALVKVFPILDWSKRLDREDEIAYESRVIATTSSGQVVGVGEAICSSKERNWRRREEYAIKSMSQTRATSKALRTPLGWIMVLAGYNPTPAEEMDSLNTIDKKREVQKETEKAEKTNEEEEETVVTEVLDNEEELSRAEIREMTVEEIGLWAIKKLRGEGRDITGAELGKLLMPYNRKRWLSSKQFKEVKNWFRDEYMRG